MLEAGRLLLAPTDTVWGILCDATNPNAVSKVYELKKRPYNRAMVCMVSDIEMLKKYIADFPKNTNDYINDQRPTTVIYNNPVGIAKNAVAQEGTIAVSYTHLTLPTIYSV